ncbi:MAG: HEAT repeat domain-containing protein [Planctomycetota bacterium]|nr:HEAT repeat domain-containing protein [Planctomycetota bacterium]
MEWNSVAWTRAQRAQEPKLSRRAVLIASLSVWLFPGCKLFSGDKKTDFEKSNAKLKDLQADPDRLRLIGEVARASGVRPRRFESLGLVTNLPGTGGVVKPSAQRDMMLEEIRRNDILDAERLLDSPMTATAKLSLYANACDEKGDLADILVECSAECDATDLREGRLMESHLFEYFTVKDSQLRKSLEKATARGDLLVFPASYSKTTQVEPLKGVILSGGKIKDESRMAILVSEDYRHVHWVKTMEASINRRFFYQDSGKQVTVAKGRNDREVKIAALPKYRFDPTHYLGTILSLGFAENQEQVNERLAGCRRMLGNPELARKAAWELEAIGSPEAAEALKLALANENDDVRFYAAYSLAYMDQPESVPILESLARIFPKYRAHCLIGLSVNQHASAREALESLLQDPDPEIRFGAYWYLHYRDSRNPMIAGEPIGESFRLVRIPSEHSLICVAMERRPEVILFGPTPELKIVKQLEPTPSLRITPMSSGLIRVAKRTLSGEILQTIITSDLVSLIKSMIAVQGNYGDLVHTLDAIERCGACSTAVAMHPLPRTGRLYGTPTEVESVESGSSESGSSESGLTETLDPESQDYPQEASSSAASARNGSVVKELEPSSSESRSYATSKTPWYRRMPFTNPSD